MAHLLVLSNVQYLQNLASGFENTVICGPKTMSFSHRLQSFEDIENGRRPNDAPCKAADFTSQALSCLININGLNWAVRIKNSRFLMW
jgi:hypothetical protein